MGDPPPDPLGRTPVDEDDEKSQLNTGIASLGSELMHSTRV